MSPAPTSDCVVIIGKLEQLRIQLAEYEASRHSTRINAFMRSSETTVQGRINEGEWATLDLNADILRVRAEIATLEDRLKVELIHAQQA